MNAENEIIQVPRRDLAIAREPKVILAEAKKAAEALMEVVGLKKKPVIFNGEQYLEFEDWQTVAKFYGLTTRIVEDQFVDFGAAKGFEATAEAIDCEGRVVSRAKAMCLNDEENWSTRAKFEYEDELDEHGNKIWMKNKEGKSYVKRKKIKVGEAQVPLFQLRSMAQTRACAKSLRGVLAWVVVLAGYKPTVAEELTGDEFTENGAGEQQPPAKKPQPVTDNIDFKAMQAKFAGSCKKCEKRIEPGEQIMYSSRLKAAYHPACLNPASETPANGVTKAMIANLEKLALEAKVKLVERIGRDGHENYDRLTVAYVNELLAEFARIIDGERE